MKEKEAKKILLNLRDFKINIYPTGDENLCTKEEMQAIEAVLNLLEKKDKIIDNMTNLIYNWDDVGNLGSRKMIKEYFNNLVEERNE